MHINCYHLYVLRNEKVRIRNLAIIDLVSPGKLAYKQENNIDNRIIFRKKRRLPKILMPKLHLSVRVCVCELAQRK